MSNIIQDSKEKIGDDSTTKCTLAEQKICKEKEFEKIFQKDREERLYRKMERKIFSQSKNKYRFYRFFKRVTQHSDGCIFGTVDGFLTGLAAGCKWAGAGGWIIGGFAQMFGCIIGSTTGAIIGFCFGLSTDINYIQEYWQNYRDTIGNGAENIRYAATNNTKLEKIIP